jgi:hypothetical protein
VKHALQKKFVVCLSEEEKKEEFDLKSAVNFRVLFSYHKLYHSCMLTVELFIAINSHQT